MTYGFYAAGAANILGMLLFSKGFTNASLGELYPGVFGRFGCAAVIVWGLAYLAAAKRWKETPALSGVFALEKALYFASWLLWLSRRGSELAALWGRDPFTTSFYALYGPLDLGLGLFFAWAAWSAWFRPAAPRP